MPRLDDERTRLRIYKRLLEINKGFERVRRGLTSLGRTGAFDRTELSRFRALSAETRAALASYVTGVIETQETDEAGRLSRRRLTRERHAEAGDG